MTEAADVRTRRKRSLERSNDIEDFKEDQCKPVKSLDDLMKWEPDSSLSWPLRIINKAPTTNYKIRGFGHDCHTSINNSSPTPRVDSRTTPKTLLCHVIENYSIDRFPEGQRGRGDVYSFFHWSAIDIFVYFGKYFVTIPPLGWLNAGHRHGCKVLGTIYSSHEEGEELWTKITTEKSLMQEVINKLLDLCRFYRFDGYVLDIENRIPARCSESLVGFVKHLKEDMKANGLDVDIIWNESVIIPTGLLEKQNRLNIANRKFFDVCDGIILNCLWKMEDLAVSTVNSGPRKLDVYIGVDVTRGKDNSCVGGGFNTKKAIDAIEEYGLSLALISANWTFNKCPAGVNYLPRELMFWNLIWNSLYMHGPCTVPFTTSFCIGKGKAKFFRGKKTDDEPWMCLAEQEFQPTTCYCLDIPVVIEEDDLALETGCLGVFENDSYRGGNCLIVSTGRFQSHHSSFLRLFMCDFSHKGRIIVDYSVKAYDELSALLIVLLVEDTAGFKRVVLVSDSAHKLMTRHTESLTSLHDLASNPDNQLLRATDTKVDQNDWVTSYFTFITQDRTIREVSCLHIGVCAVLLGKLTIKPVK